MKLVAKLTALLLLGTCLVWAAYGYLTAARERGMFERTLAEDARATAATLRAAVERVSQVEGNEAALRLIAQVDAGDRQHHFAHQPLADLPPSIRAQLEAGRDIVRFETGDPGRLLVMTPLSRPSGSALLFEESLDREERYMDQSLYRIVGASLCAIFVSALLAFLIGYRVVGRPVQELIAKARRIGEGDLSGPLELPQQDEIGALAGELNLMCDQIAQETQRRLQAQEQLYHAERVTTVGRLASGVAHELGTPLNVVLGRASLLEDHTDPEVQEQARSISVEIERMSGIIRQLLDFARRETGARVVVDLADLLHQASTMIYPLAKGAEVEIRTQVDADSAPVHGDPDQLQQVISNLLVNGIQAQSPGGTVQLTLASNEDEVTLRVLDEGPGIPPDSLPRVFEPFFTTKEVGEGTGLGLSVAHGIVTDHGGRIEVENRSEAGACFSVTLPRSKSE